MMDRLVRRRFCPQEEEEENEEGDIAEVVEKQQRRSPRNGTATIMENGGLAEDGEVKERD